MSLLQNSRRQRIAALQSPENPRHFGILEGRNPLRPSPDGLLQGAQKRCFFSGTFWRIVSSYRGGWKRIFHAHSKGGAMSAIPRNWMMLLGVGCGLILGGREALSQAAGE